MVNPRTAFAALLGMVLPALAFAQGGSIANPRPLSCSVVAQACNVQIPPSGALLTTTGNGSGLTNLSGAQLAVGSLALGKVAAIADKTILANISGVSASPAASSLTALLDNILGSTHGSIIFRGASSWSVLTAGINGQFLQTQGTSANPQWAAPSGSGTVNNGTANQLAYYASSSAAVSGTTALPNGTTATTQATGDNTTKVATTAGVRAEIGVAMPTGIVMPYVGSAAPGGWLLMWGTIGNASSGASNRANADTLALYTLLWNSMADAQAPVSGGRGASAAADFAANKTIAVPDMRGRVPAGKDNMGGATASRLTASGLGVAGTTLGISGGADTHTLTIAQMPSHSHGVNDPSHIHNYSAGSNPAAGTTRGTFGDGSNLGFATTEAAFTGISIQANGGNGAHPNVQPTLVLNYIIRMRRRPANDNGRGGVRYRRPARCRLRRVC